MRKLLLFCLMASLCSLWAIDAPPPDGPDILLTAPDSLVVPPPPNAVFSVTDKPNDDGRALTLGWSAEWADSARVERLNADGQWERYMTVDAGYGSIVDNRDLIPGHDYTYRIIFTDAQGRTLSIEEAVGAPVAQWFNTSKVSLLIMSLLLAGAILYYIFSARRGKELFIRRIAGLDSMDEAVGRATEMGKPILFVPGINDIDDMQTIAGLTILGKLAQTAAEYDAQILVPVSRSMVMSTAREIVKESYMKAGRPDAYKADSVFYLTDDQFGFVAGVDGIMVREKPAANFFLGAFYAESLILAETGFASGSIQTAGTAMPSQLPFFVAACDFTLIGEELFAASAYLSRDPHQLGSLKGQDFGKLVLVILLALGVLQQIVGMHFLSIKDFLSLH